MNGDIDPAILRRLQKCLRLSESTEPHEAAAAMRQAKKIMEEHGIFEMDAELADVKECSTTTAQRADKVSQWLAYLARVISNAYGVDRFYRPGLSKAYYVFVGVSPSIECAEYTFTVLRRRLQKDRATYYKKLRGKRLNKIRRSDAYAMGWVVAVSNEVKRFATPTPSIVNQYMKLKHADLVAFTPRDRTSSADNEHTFRGYNDGSNQTLQHGVDVRQTRRLPQGVAY